MIGWPVKERGFGQAFDARVQLMAIQSSVSYWIKMAGAGCGVAAAIIAGVAAVLGNMKEIVESAEKFITLFQKPTVQTELSIRDVRAVFVYQDTDVFFRPKQNINVGIEAVVTHSGPEKCKAELGIETKNGHVVKYYGSMDKIVGREWKITNIIDIGDGSSEIPCAFHISVPQELFAKTVTFRLLCDKIVTPYVNIALPNPEPPPY
ncbi:hypothetical protein [Methylosinus sp. PW1]|uniref:hypothetical protein n=1 Tax=Methylosinus sp. PW1 TaxID=107636 RepID=UPI0012EB98B4|nr:hypothetical protein [Methylosinus sp. PW1]